MSQLPLFSAEVDAERTLKEALGYAGPQPVSMAEASAMIDQRKREKGGA